MKFVSHFSSSFVYFLSRSVWNRSTRFHEYDSNGTEFKSRPIWNWLAVPTGTVPSSPVETLGLPVLSMSRFSVEPIPWKCWPRVIWNVFDATLHLLFVSMKEIPSYRRLSIDLEIRNSPINSFINFLCEIQGNWKELPARDDQWCTLHVTPLKLPDHDPIKYSVVRRTSALNIYRSIMNWDQVNTVMGDSMWKLF